MKRFLALFLAATLSWLPGLGHADLRATSGAFGPAAITSGTIGTGVTGLPTLLAQSFVPVSAGNDVTEDTLATITVPPNTLGANGALRITTFWTTTNSANNKVLRVRYSGGAGTVFLQTTVTASASYVAATYIANRNATNSQVGNVINGAQAGGIGGSTASLATAAVDTTASTSLVVTCQKTLNTETCTLEGYTVEVIH